MCQFYLGIDVAKAKLDCALRLPDGKFKNKVVENTLKGFKTLTEWIEKHDAATAHVCMEATGVYWEVVAEYLAGEGMMVSVVNPAQIKAFGKSQLVRTKTDAVDARLIAEFCAERHLEPWRAPTPRVRRRRRPTICSTTRCCTGLISGSTPGTGACCRQATGFS